MQRELNEENFINKFKLKCKKMRLYLCHNLNQLNQKKYGTKVWAKSKI